MYPQNEQTSEIDLTQFATFEDFLDSQISERDLFYLEDIEVARKLVELGLRGDGEPLTKLEFDKKRQSQIPQRDALPKRQLCSKDIDVSGDPLLKALAEREDKNRFGQLSTIVFIRMINSKGQEISGYIDYANRLDVEDFRPIFKGKKPFVPKSTDLSFFNWKTRTMAVNHSLNYQVITTDVQGLIFKNKRDRKHIRVDPYRNLGENTSRTTIQVPQRADGKDCHYLQVVFYDHSTRHTK